MFVPASIIALAASSTFATPLTTRAGCTINSVSSAAGAEQCSTITIEGFTVPAKQKLEIKAPNRATINLRGNIVFEADTTFETAGPLFTLSGNDITFNGNGFTIDGQGEKYWDGDGTSDKAKHKKPHPMIKLSCSGIVQNVKVLNSPAQVFSTGNDAALTISKVTVDNSAGNKPNGLSGGKPAAHNTDGFDVANNDVTIQDSTVINQDDCLAVNRGSNIVFQNNHCTGGHGISIGSVNTGATVSNVHISGNTITDNVQALRIKTFARATSGSVSGITYKDNTASGCKEFGVIIDQSYPNTLSTDTGAGVKISDITFTGTNRIVVASSAKGEVEVNCAKGGCLGTWNWSGLEVSGGKPGTITNANISGFKL